MVDIYSFTVNDELRKLIRRRLPTGIGRVLDAEGFEVFVSEYINGSVRRAQVALRNAVPIQFGDLRRNILVQEFSADNPTARVYIPETPHYSRGNARSTAGEGPKPNNKLAGQQKRAATLTLQSAGENKNSNIETLRRAAQEAFAKRKADEETSLARARKDGGAARAKTTGVAASANLLSMAELAFLLNTGGQVGRFRKAKSGDQIFEALPRQSRRVSRRAKEARSAGQVIKDLDAAEAKFSDAAKELRRTRKDIREGRGPAYVYAEKIKQEAAGYRARIALHKQDEAEADRRIETLTGERVKLRLKGVAADSPSLAPLDRQIAEAKRSRSEAQASIARVKTQITDLRLRNADLSGSRLLARFLDQSEYVSSRQTARTDEQKKQNEIDINNSEFRRLGIDAASAKSTALSRAGQGKAAVTKTSSFSAYTRRSDEQAVYGFPKGSPTSNWFSAANKNFEADMRKAEPKLTQGLQKLAAGSSLDLQAAQERFLDVGRKFGIGSGAR